jgi:hypothetical protein
LAVTPVSTSTQNCPNLQTALAEVANKPPSFDEVWPGVEQTLTDAEAVFRRIGPGLDHVGGPLLPEHAWHRHQAMIGASMVANRKAVLDSERARIRAATDGGLSQADRTRRLDQLRASILKAAANRELLVREIEGADFTPRPVHPELLVYPQAEVERLAG